MIKQIAKKWQVNIAKSFMIGDKETDMKCAIKSNLKFAYRSENFFSQIKNFS
jgi:histidinol phosphatase-like enzyme